MVRKHQELLERLEEASAARTQLVLELHQAQGEHRCGPGRAVGHAGRGAWGRAVLTEVLQAKCRTKLMPGKASDFRP